MGVTNAVTMPVSRSVTSSIVRRILGIFSPLSLFANGEQGAWYDPSDLSTLYQDAAGTTPVTADGQPVGLMEDKSGNGNHVTQTVAASRPTYRTDGTLHWLEFDGVDDFLAVPNSKSTFAFLHQWTGGIMAVAYQSGAADLGTSGQIIGTSLVGSSASAGSNIQYNSRQASQNCQTVVNRLQPNFRIVAESALNTPRGSGPDILEHRTTPSALELYKNTGLVGSVSSAHPQHGRQCA